ncbi:ABC transporter permease [Pikeienuella piscinae]|uniref:ABC transporter permease n=1 Tax=Pikeienuella piscinae TaxID=2748098 RepID=A0A7L5BYE0_9RHOB|nr:ABC transporter permease [Pikeienuella piscinae]QIE56143.1 ABC transporter permease [Pikeienuella piscinae]
MNHPPLPAWADLGLLPLLNILAAFVVSGLIIAAIGENPLNALVVMMKGAFVYKGGLGYTLYYTTNFIFTGLAVAVAFHAAMFNIGGEGQAYIGGLGAGLAVLVADQFLPGILLIPFAVIFSALFGAAWAFIPGWLQATRGSHIVITTIMFNFIAASLMVSLLAGPLMRSGQGAPETRPFAEAAKMPYVHDMLAAVGIETARSPLNASLLIALGAAVLVWFVVWRTRFGYALRAMGASPGAAEYAGMNTVRITVLTLLLSGGLAGLMASNAVLGEPHKLVLNFTGGYGFTGIAVALMGRNHPVGVVLAALLFGALTQGGTELDFEFQTITRETVQVVQGLIILFSGALAYLFAPAVARALALIAARRGAAA